MSAEWHYFASAWSLWKACSILNEPLPRVRRGKEEKKIFR
jgi:hypothetical protein